MFNPRGLHVDVPLSNVITNRRPQNFFADQIIPAIPVDKASDMYYKMRHGEWARYENGLTLRAPRTTPRKVHFSTASDNYSVKNYALASDYGSEDVANADAILRYAERHGMFVMDRLMMDYEWRVAQMAVNTSNVATVTQVGCAWTLGQAPILTQMLDYKETFRQQTGMSPNMMIIPKAHQRYISTNSQLVGVVYGAQRGGLVTLDQLKNLLEIEKIIVPTTQVNTFGEQETMNGSWSYADVWGNESVWMGYVDTLPAKETDTWIQAFRWTDPELGVPFALERLPYDPRAKTYEIQVGYYQDEKVVSRDLCWRIRVTST